MSNTGYEYFVNAGPYTALVPSVDDRDESQGGSTTTSNTVEELQEIKLVMAVVAQSPATDLLVVDTSIALPSLTYDAAKTALVGAVPPGTELEVIKGVRIE